jgi:hypothetical protein
MIHAQRTFRSLACFVLLAAGLGLTTTGCIRSMVVITSEPSDALVKVNHVPRGHTPIEVPIIWYWYYQIELEKEGYEPISAEERFKAPPWAVPPIDLLAEAVPFPIKNSYPRHYQLEPETSP